MTPQDIALYYNRGTLGSFSQSLMDLFCRADSQNKIKLGVAYPEYYEAYYLWFNGEYPKDNEIESSDA